MHNPLTACYQKGACLLDTGAGAVFESCAAFLLALTELAVPIEMPRLCCNARVLAVVSRRVQCRARGHVFAWLAQLRGLPAVIGPLITLGLDLLAWCEAPPAIT